MNYSISNPSLLALENGEHTGGSQQWFSGKWQRMSGCGPVTAANIFWYLSLSHPSLSVLCDAREGDKAAFLYLMERMFEFIAPGANGVNNSKIFISGAQSYSASRDITLAASSLEIPARPARRPNTRAVAQFIADALARDLPVAFLNLSNGGVHGLENWHWVTLLALNTGTMMAGIADQGKTLEVDLGHWSKLSMLGGAFVSLGPAG